MICLLFLIYVMFPLKVYLNYWKKTAFFQGSSHNNLPKQFMVEKNLGDYLVQGSENYSSVSIQNIC